MSAPPSGPGDRAVLRRLTGLQRELAARVCVDPADPRTLSVDDLDGIEIVAGVDVSFDRDSVWLHAAAVALRWPTLECLEVATATLEAELAYVPGYLNFREVPAFCAALERLEHTPDVVVVDGHGIAHPRRLGVAAHCGVLLDLPAIGCAKKILRGECQTPSQTPGDRTALAIGETQVGWALRTRRRAHPVYVSPGHRIDLDAAVELVWACSRGYKLPEPTRLAHEAANEARRCWPGAGSVQDSG